MKITASLTILATTLAMFSANAFAEDESFPISQFIKAFDLDGDWSVTRTEMEMVFLQTKFQLLDEDADGVLTEAEWTSVPEARDSLGEFASRDCDEDQRVSLAEFVASASWSHTFARVFQVLDRDGDDRVNGEDECSMMLVASR
tara:strand:+ start:4414 stop:4845 length:432 start_codon:yes stop_codon:yes gene_type:complete